MRTPMLEEKIWMAGFIDGEGHIGIVKNPPRLQNPNGWFTPVVNVTQLGAEALHIFQDIYGGHITLNKKPGGYIGTYAIWRPHITGMPLLLADVLPFLRVKQAQCKLMLTYISLGKSPRGVRVTEELFQSRQFIYEQIHSLNNQYKKRIKT